MPSFSGKDIFGTQIRQNGPIPRTRLLREQLPGVAGFRVYQLTGRSGPETLTWTLQGRLTAVSAAALTALIAKGQAYMNQIGDFIALGGVRYKNCLLVDFRPAPPIRRCRIAGANWYTVEVTATIEQMSP